MNVTRTNACTSLRPYAFIMMIILSCLYITIVSSAVIENPNAGSKHILFISIPLPGHVGPLMAQGHELANRGWRVSIASPTRLKSFIENRLVQPTNQLGGSIQYWSAGSCPIAEEADGLFLKCALSPDFSEGSTAIFEWATRLYPCMYTAIVEHLRKEQSLPTLIVSDAVTWVGPDLGEDFNIPFAINNADLLYLLSPHVLPPFDSVPGAMSSKSSHAMKPTHGLLERVLYPPVRLLLVGHIMTGMQQLVNQQRLAVGSTTQATILDAYKGRLILVDSAFGLEYPRPLPPLIHMVGPMVIDNQESLSQSDREWLDNDERPVVFVSFGTLAPLQPDQASRLVEGLRSESYRALFKLDRSMHHVLPTLLPTNVRVESWVSSQQAHLAHPKVQVFVSHCGINSAHESVYFGTALLCIPMFGDQLDMGYRVQDSGTGFWLDKLTFTPANVSNYVNTILEDKTGSIKFSLSRLSQTLRMAGGVRRAADLLEHVALHGTYHLSTPDIHYPIYALYKLDQYAAWLLLSIIPILLIWSCFKCCQCCCCRRRATRTHATGTSEMNGKSVNGKKHD